MLDRILRNPGKCLKPARGESGQALVETAVTVPLMILMLVGAAELARVAYAAIEVSNAASAAVQYGAQGSGYVNDGTGIALVASNDASDLLSGMLTTDSAVSCVCSDGSASTCGNSDCSGSKIVRTLTVTTSAVIPNAFNLPGLNTSFTLRGRASQKVRNQ